MSKLVNEIMEEIAALENKNRKTGYARDYELSKPQLKNLLESKLAESEAEVSRLKEENESLKQRVGELEIALRKIYEVWAGSDRLIPETCPEGYQEKLIKDMRDIASEALNSKEK